MIFLARTLFLGICLCSAILAQSFPFSIRVQQADFAGTVPNGGSVTINTPVGQSESIGVVLTYLGRGQASILRAPELAGSTSFSLVNAGPTPITLQPLQQYSFNLRFAPTRSSSVGSQLTLDFSESIPLSGGGQDLSVGKVLLQLLGTSPEFALSYLFPEQLNYVPLNNGGRISFPATLVNGTASVVISVVNRGSGSGELNVVGLEGEDFQLAGVPLLPASMTSLTELRFQLRFQPKTPGVKTGRLFIGGAGGIRVVDIEGSSFVTTFEYESINASGIAALQPGSTINLGEALPGELLNTQILVRNVNPVAVPFPAVSIFGVGYSVFDVPSTQGLVLQPGETRSFFVQGAISQIGVSRGRLRIGLDTFDLQATGSGVQLRYSYSSSGSGSIAVLPSASVFFPGTRIGERSVAAFTIRNSGLSDADIIGISILDTASGFTLSNLPALPAKIPAGGEIGFQIAFSPSAAGVVNGVLRIDGAQFALSGTASALPPLPGYSLTLSSTNIGPLEQPSVSLTLDGNYPVALSGVLTLAQDSGGLFGDPSVRFSNGQQAVAFTIPANTRQAVFSNGLGAVRFQTGSVASNLILQASFTVGATSVVDPNPQVVRLRVPPTSPRILVSRVERGVNALLLSVTGLAVTRSLTKMEVEVVPLPGVSFERARFSIDLSGASTLWFSNETSQTSGGIFTLSLPINFSVTGNSSSSTGSNVIDSVASLRVSLSNEVGNSSTQEVLLR